MIDEFRNTLSRSRMPIAASPNGILTRETCAGRLKNSKPKCASIPIASMHIFTSPKSMPRWGVLKRHGTP